MVEETETDMTKKSNEGTPCWKNKEIIEDMAKECTD